MIALLQIQTYIAANYKLWLTIVVGVLVGAILIRLLNMLIMRFFARVDFDETVELFLQRVFAVFLWAILITLVAANLGFDVSAFIAGLGIMGFIIGFATRDVFSNVAAGLMLLITKPFKVHEQVEISGIKGEVQQISLSYTLLFAETGEYVAVPNTKIWNSPMRNYSRKRVNQ